MYRDLIEMVKIPSVSTSGKENQVADYIYDNISSISYFQQNPGDIEFWPCVNDPFGRKSVFAIVRATPATERTVILTGHMDVVTADMCGSLSNAAFDPEKYTELIRGSDLPSGARSDLGSGDWLFGRGTADMKAGLAAGIDQLRKAAADPSVFDVNIAVLFVPDEENNSVGMTSAVPYLKNLSEKGLEFLACIDMEPSFPVGESYTPTAYLGTVGKVNTFFYFEGIGTHVGEYFSGISAGLISSCLNLEMDGNPDFIDRRQNYHSLPFGCLKIKDMREEYSASIVNRGSHIYSYVTVSHSPSDILIHLEKTAQKGLADAIDLYRKRCSQYAAKTGSAITSLDLVPKVMSFRELEEIAAEKAPDISRSLEEKELFADDSRDERDRALSFVSELTKVCNIEPPFVVYGFLPPWYPHRANENATEGDRVLKASVQDLVDNAAEKFSLNIDTKPFFEGICDLSYCGYRGKAEDITELGANMPGWGSLYSLPAEDLAEIDIPVLNFGPVGKDLHKKTERLCLSFLFDFYPELLSSVIRSIGKHST